MATAACSAAADNPAAARSAERCWTLCLEVLDAAPDAGVLDEIVGLVVNAAGGWSARCCDLARIGLLPAIRFITRLIRDPQRTQWRL